MGALTRIQSGLRSMGVSGRCAFSGWRGRGPTVSSTTAKGISRESPGFLTAYLRSGREPGKTWIHKTWNHKSWDHKSWNHKTWNHKTWIQKPRIQRAGSKSVRPSATFGPG